MLNDHSPLATRHHSGFTLIELSIVLVIIGLIIGGVLVGRDLIASSEIRAQIKQIEEFKTATNAFKAKYGYLPGDIPPTETAQLGFFTFTGAYAGSTIYQAVCCSWGYRYYSFGNNDGQISRTEQYVFWEHLSEAKMIPGEYGGTQGGVNYLETNADTTAGGMMVNGTHYIGDFYLFQPRSKVAKIVSSSGVETIKVRSNHYYTKYLYYNYTNSENFFELYMTTRQASIIDQKIDDGSTTLGSVRDSSMAFTYLNLIVPYDVSPANADSAMTLHILW